MSSNAKSSSVHAAKNARLHKRSVTWTSVDNTAVNKKYYMIATADTKYLISSVNPLTDSFTIDSSGQIQGSGLSQGNVFVHDGSNYTLEPSESVTDDDNHFKISLESISENSAATKTFTEFIQLSFENVIKVGDNFYRLKSAVGIDIKFSQFDHANTVKDITGFTKQTSASHVAFLESSLPIIIANDCKAFVANSYLVKDPSNVMKFKEMSATSNLELTIQHANDIVTLTIATNSSESLTIKCVPKSLTAPCSENFSLDTTNKTLKYKNLPILFYDNRGTTMKLFFVYTSGYNAVHHINTGSLEITFDSLTVKQNSQILKSMSAADNDYSVVLGKVAQSSSFLLNLNSCRNLKEYPSTGNIVETTGEFNIKIEESSLLVREDVSNDVFTSDNILARCVYDAANTKSVLFYKDSTLASFINFKSQNLVKTQPKNDVPYNRLFIDGELYDLQRQIALTNQLTNVNLGSQGKSQTFQYNTATSVDNFILMNAAKDVVYGVKESATAGLLNKEFATDFAFSIVNVLDLPNPTAQTVEIVVNLVKVLEFKNDGGWKFVCTVSGAASTNNGNSIQCTSDLLLSSSGLFYTLNGEGGAAYQNGKLYVYSKEAFGAIDNIGSEFGYASGSLKIQTLGYQAAQLEKSAVAKLALTSSESNKRHVISSSTNPSKIYFKASDCSQNAVKFSASAAENVIISATTYIYDVSDGLEVSTTFSKDKTLLAACIKDENSSSFSLRSITDQTATLEVVETTSGLTSAQIYFYDNSRLLLYDGSASSKLNSITTDGALQPIVGDTNYQTLGSADKAIVLSSNGATVYAVSTSQFFAVNAEFAIPSFSPVSKWQKVNLSSDKTFSVVDKNDITATITYTSSDPQIKITCKPSATSSSGRNSCGSMTFPSTDPKTLTLGAEALIYVRGSELLFLSGTKLEISQINGRNKYTISSDFTVYDGPVPVKSSVMSQDTGASGVVSDEAQSVQTVYGNLPEILGNTIRAVFTSSGNSYAYIAALNDCNAGSITLNSANNVAAPASTYYLKTNDDGTALETISSILSGDKNILAKCENQKLTVPSHVETTKFVQFDAIAQIANEPSKKPYLFINGVFYDPSVIVGGSSIKKLSPITSTTSNISSLVEPSVLILGTNHIIRSADGNIVYATSVNGNVELNSEYAHIIPSQNFYLNSFDNSYYGEVYFKIGASTVYIDFKGLNNNSQNEFYCTESNLEKKSDLQCDGKFIIAQNRKSMSWENGNSVAIISDNKMYLYSTGVQSSRQHASQICTGDNTIEIKTKDYQQSQNSNLITSFNGKIINESSRIVLKGSDETKSFYISNKNCNANSFTLNDINSNALTLQSNSILEDSRVVATSDVKCFENVIAECNSENNLRYLREKALELEVHETLVASSELFKHVIYDGTNMYRITKEVSEPIEVIKEVDSVEAATADTGPISLGIKNKKSILYSQDEKIVYGVVTGNKVAFNKLHSFDFDPLTFKWAKFSPTENFNMTVQHEQRVGQLTYEETESKYKFNCQSAASTNPPAEKLCASKMAPNQKNQLPLALGENSKIFADGRNLLVLTSANLTAKGVDLEKILTLDNDFIINSKITESSMSTGTIAIIVGASVAAAVGVISIVFLIYRKIKV